MIEVKDLTKRFAADGGYIDVLDKVSFSVGTGRLFTLLGPSGCGKSTLLRCIAGLETPDAGEISIGGETVFSSARGINIPAHHRQIGMVFQSYAIWPHMTVFQNVAFPLEVRGREAIDAQVEAVLELVGLAGYGPRSATKLSGGQQQRVALARALVSKPDVLLLDEPLSNLDAKLREQLRGELKRIKETVGATTLFVTHDQNEALSLSDDIAVVNQGHIIEIGSPEELYEKPRTEFTAQFLGNANVIPVVAVEEDRVQSTIGTVHTAVDGAGRDERMASIAIRPERIRVSATGHPSPQPGENQYPARVLSRVYFGQHVELLLKIDGAPPLRSLAPLHQAHVAVGDDVFLSFKPEHAIPLARS